MGPLIPIFWTSGDVFPGFQSQGGPLAWFLARVILRFTSGVIPADCIEVSMAAKPFRSTYLQICLQALVEAWARTQNHDHQCCTKPLWLGYVFLIVFQIYFLLIRWIGWIQLEPAKHDSKVLKLCCVSHSQLLSVMVSIPDRGSVDWGFNSQEGNFLFQFSVV